jgi:hypothetical protein
MATSTSTYNSENWTINRTDNRKIEAAEIKFLRNLAGYTLIDQKCNTDIRAELNIYHLRNKIKHETRLA